MHPILKAQLKDATDGTGLDARLDIGQLIDAIGRFYEMLDGSDTSIQEVLASTAAHSLTEGDEADDPFIASMASNSGIRARFEGVLDDDVRAVLDSVADMVITVDAQGLIHFSNRVAVNFFDASQRTLAGRSLPELLCLPADMDIATFLEPFIAELDTTHPDLSGGEFTGMRMDGSEFMLELTASRLSAKSAGEYVICLRDISVRAAAAAALRENEERYRALVEYAPDAILVFDVESSQFVDANENACQLFNLPRKRLLASGFLGARGAPGEASASGERSRIDAFLQRALDGGQPIFEWLYAGGAGYEVPCEVRLSRMPAIDRSLVRVSVQSIASRKRHELVDYSEKKLLEMIASGVPFKKVMRAICRSAERVIPGSRAVVMLVDTIEDELCLHSAPAFSTKELKPIQRMTLSEPRLSCGVAIATNKPVITPDVHAHNAWADYAAFARRSGIAAAWSVPLTPKEGRPMGTLDIYFDHKREPTTEELDWLNGVARMAGIAINREHSSEALLQSEGRFRGLFENVVEGVYISRLNGELIAVNPALVNMLGYENEQAMLSTATRDTGYANPKDAQQFERDITDHGEVRRFEAVMMRCDGEPIDIIENARAVDYPDGERYIEGTVSDITERKAAERRIFEEKERAEVTLKSIGDGVITTDADGCVEYLNPVAEDLTGWSLRTVRGQRIEDVLTLINEHSRELIDNPIIRCLQEGRVIAMSAPSLLIDRSGKEIAVQDSAAPIRDRLGHIVGSVMVFHDVSAAGRLSRKLSYQASHDALTGFINRQEFENVLERAIAQSRNDEERQFALLYIDLDQFKVVNDTFGHTAGDELIRQIAGCLQTCVPTSDMVARLGGDEFAVLLDRTDSTRAVQVAEDIRASIEAYRFEWQNAVHSVHSSIGVVMVDRDSATVSALLSAADVACFVAKDMGRNQVHMYKEGEAGVRHQQMHWLTRIDRALEEERFELYFQPIVSTADESMQGQCTHYELLLRMADEEGNMVLPGTFIAAAERYNRMPALDRWVVAEALMHADHGDPEAAAAYTLSINLSGNSLSDDRFLEYVTDSLQSKPLCAGAVCFEITETAAIANLTRVMHFMNELKKLGCLFSLDDFGSGLSSFAYLKNLPVDFIKVDGAFVRNIAYDRVDQSMVSAIQQVGQAMGIQAIAEHVETEEIRQTLGKIGIPLMQGYHIARPVSIRSFSPWTVAKKLA